MSSSNGQNSVYKYQIYCITEGKFVQGYGEQSPTTCYHDTTHTINPNSVQVLDLIGPNTVISVDASPADGNFQISNIEFEIPPNPTGNTQIIYKTITYPFDLYLWQMSITPPFVCVGDILSLIIGKDTPIGYLTQPALAGQTTLSVSSTVITYVYRGYQLGITLDPTAQPIVYEDLDMITHIDKTNSTITVQKPLSVSYPAGAVLLLSLYPLKEVVLDTYQRFVLGAKGTKAKLIPANTPITIKYTDNTVNAEPLKLYFLIEYYFN